VAGASIPYPVNYLINFGVILVFIIVILCIASYRYYKSRAARARRRRLTGKQCLNLNMTGIRGRYPPKRIKMLIEANEHKRQREAEAAAREYVTDRSEAVDPSGTVLHDPELKSGGYRDSGVADERAIGGSQDHSTKVPTDELRGPKPMQPIDTVSSVDTAPMIPTFVLSVEQNVHAAEGDLVAPEGNIESDVPAVVLPSAGQSQSNVTYPPAEVTSATKSSTGTQTSPRDNTDVEMNDSSQEGSFDDSVTSF